MARKLLDRLRDTIRTRHYSYRTEQAYVHWVRRFILFHEKRHPLKMGKGEVEAFLTYLAVNRRVAASTQNVALNAILFLYREVLEIKLPWLDDVVRAKRPTRMPVVLDREEIRQILSQLRSPHDLVVQLLYGSGLRLSEALGLRVKDINFHRRELTIREGKGGKDRVTVLADSCRTGLRHQVEITLERAALDRKYRLGGAILPFALDRKYPKARHLPRLPAQFCHASAGIGGGYPHRSATAGPLERSDHHDLHPRYQPRRPRRAQPAG